MKQPFLKLAVLACVLAVGPVLVTARAETAPQAPASLEKQKLISELAEMEAEVERVRRTRGEAGLYRQGLKRKLAEKKAMTQYHLTLIERLEHAEQRLHLLETRLTAR